MFTNGRPKKVPDHDILAAVGRAIGRSGPDGFTIREVAADAGIAPATVMQRFSSRRLLLRAFVEEGMDRLGAAFSVRPGEQVADILVRAFGASRRQALHRSEMSNHIAMHAADICDPHLRRATQTHFQRLRTGIEALLHQAVRNGELSAITDVPAVARSLETVCHGTLVMWAVATEDALEDALRGTIRAALAPIKPGRPARA